MASTLPGTPDNPAALAVSGRGDLRFLRERGGKDDGALGRVGTVGADVTRPLGGDAGADRAQADHLVGGGAEQKLAVAAVGRDADGGRAGRVGAAVLYGDAGEGGQRRIGGGVSGWWSAEA